MFYNSIIRCVYNTQLTLAKRKIETMWLVKGTKKKEAKAKMDPKKKGKKDFFF